MADIYSILADIYKGIGDTVKECGFEPVIPEGTEKDACPTVTDSGRITIEFKGENKALKIEHFNNKLTLFGASKEGEIIASDFSVLSSSLLEAETANDKDVKYFVNDYCETLVETFGTKTQKPKRASFPSLFQRLPQRAVRSPTTPTPSRTDSQQSIPSCVKNISQTVTDTVNSCPRISSLITAMRLCLQPSERTIPQR